MEVLLSSIRRHEDRLGWKDLIRRDKDDSLT